MFNRLFMAVLSAALFVGQAFGQLGPVNPPTTPWGYAAPLAYLPSGNCVALPQSVTGGCPASNSINIAGGYYVDGIALQTIASVSPPLNIAGGALGFGPVACSTHQWIQSFNSSGVQTCLQPSASDLSSGALANGTTATTQASADNTTKVATDNFVQGAIGTDSGTANQIAYYPGAGAALTPTSLPGTGGIFDTVCSSTVGQMWVRMTGGWGCLYLGWANPRWWGATGGNQAVDLPAFQSATSAVSSGGEIFISISPSQPQPYCTAGWSVTTAGVRIVFSGTELGVGISSCGGTSSPLSINSAGITVEYGQVTGPAVVAGSAPTNPAINIGSSCGKCFLLWPFVQGGSNAILSAAADVHIIGGVYTGAYGSAIVRVTAGAIYMDRMARDQLTPTQANCTTLVNWSATASVTANACLTLTSGFILQVTANGTTGGSQPAIASYGTNITDGTATEQLYAPSTYYALQADTGASQVRDYHADNSGPFSYSIGVTNTASGSAPQTVLLDDETTGSARQGGISLAAGSNVTVSHSSIAGCAAPSGSSCDGIDIAAGFTGTFIISENTIIGGSGPDIEFLGGSSTDANGIISNNHLTGTGTYGILDNVGGVSHLDIHDNMFGSPVWGSPTTGLSIPASAGFLNVHHNDFTGTSTAISNSSAATTNRIQDNIGYNPAGLTAGTSTGTSTSTITAGPSPETHYITQSATFNAVVKSGSTTLCTVPSATVPCVIDLGPNESYSVTWSTTQPTYSKFIH